jgi:molecular chaperone GrpE (heat shock protein)
MKVDPVSPPAAGQPRDGLLQPTSTVFRLCEELIALREVNNRQHKLFEQSLAKARDELKGSFNAFAADLHRAYQQMRQEFQGEKRIALALFNELLDVAFDLQHITGTRPSTDDREAVARWIESIEVESRKVQDALRRLGIHPYDAVIASPYNPALHERVGSVRVEGLGPLLVAEQRERGYASQQPEFVLRRPKVLVSE